MTISARLTSVQLLLAARRWKMWSQTPVRPTLRHSTVVSHGMDARASPCDSNSSLKLLAAVHCWVWANFHTVASTQCHCSRLTKTMLQSCFVWQSCTANMKPASNSEILAMMKSGKCSCRQVQGLMSRIAFSDVVQQIEKLIPGIEALNILQKWWQVIRARILVEVNQDVGEHLGMFS